MYKTIVIIQARLGSSRLPGKSLMDLCGKPLIQHVIERAQQITDIDRITVATPSPFEALTMAKATDVDEVSFWGSSHLAEHDVLSRYAQIVAKLEDYDTVVRVTGDCPLLSPRIADQVIALYHSDPHVEYASNVFKSDGSAVAGAVDGEDVEVFSAEALAWAHRCASEPFDREHVTSFIRRNVKTATLPPRDPRFGVKTSVDTIEDVERIRALMRMPA